MRASENQVDPAYVVPAQFSSRRFIVWLILGTASLNIGVAAFAGLTLYQSRERDQERAVVATQNLARVLAQDLAASFGKIDLAVIAVKEEMEGRLAAVRPPQVETMNASDKTVKNYLSNAFQKLQVKRRSQAAALFSRRG